MNKSARNISINFIQEKKVPNLAISLCFSANCNFHCLRVLKATSERSDCASRFNNVEMTALAYAIFDNIRAKLMGSISDVYRSKVSHIDCEINNGSFVIFWITAGSFSALRQTISKAVSMLAPSKVYSKYAENMRIMGMAPHRETFAYVANELGRSLKSGVDIVAVGRANLDGAKLDMVVKSAADKMPAQSQMSGGSKPEHKTEEKLNYSKVKASGTTAFFVADYIDSEMKGSLIYVEDGNVVVLNKSFESKRAGLKQKDKIKRFVNSKYGKVKNNMNTLMAYVSILRGFDCSVVKSLAKTKHTISEIAGTISSAL